LEELVINMAILDLKESIIREFSIIPRPKPDKINPYPCCPEHDGMTEWFRNHDWKDFKKELEKDTLDSEFMPSEPEGFIYFLPAVLLYTLESYEKKKEKLWEWSTIEGISCAPISNWIEVLIPLFDDPNVQNYIEIRSLLNDKQVKLNGKYLSFFRDVSPKDEEAFRNNIQKALIEIW
jgi:hypothetical protein